MAKKAKLATQGILEVLLPHGFEKIPTMAMVLDVLRLKRAIIPRMDSLRKAIGTTTAERLSGFCTECLQFGETVYVTVVAKTITSGENGHSYLCLCPCGVSAETIPISSSFLKDVGFAEKPGAKAVSMFKPQQKNIARAIR